MQINILKLGFGCKSLLENILYVCLLALFKVYISIYKYEFLKPHKINK